MTPKFQLGCCLLCLLLLAGTGEAQVRNSGAQAIALTANLNEGLSISLSNYAVNFTLTAASANNPGSNGVRVATSWNTRPGRTLSVYAYFASATAALTDGFSPVPNNIPSADFLISNNGGAYTALTNSVAFGGANAGLRLYSVRITGQNKTGSHAENLLFNINLSTIPQLPAGTYHGTLNIQAQVI